MNKKLLDKAKALAHRGYSFTIQLDQISDGEKIYFAQCEELDGCMAQGKTLEEAVQNMFIALEDFIYFLLEDGMPVPDPSHHLTMSFEGTFSKEVNVFEASSGFSTVISDRIERIANGTSQRELHSSFVTAYET